MNDQRDPIELKLEALAFGGKGEGAKALGPCPTDETFGAYMDGSLTQEEKTRCSRHIAHCPECHQIYRLWKESEGGEAPPVPAQWIKAARDLVKPPITRIVLEKAKKALRLLNPEELSFLHPQQQASLGLARGKTAPPPEHGEASQNLAVKSSLPFIDAVRMQLLEKEDLLMLSLHPDPSVSAQELNGIRVDLYLAADLMQSWPLTSTGVRFNPIGKGIYRIELLHVDSGAKGELFRLLGCLELDLRGN